MKIEHIATVCHEANRAYQFLIGQEPSPSWADAPQWQVDSAIAGVRAMVLGITTDGESQWQAWKDHKLRDGWTYGAVKNAETKEHPCLVDSYDQLPLEERRKDYLFRGVVEALTQE